MILVTQSPQQLLVWGQAHLQQWNQGFLTCKEAVRSRFQLAEQITQRATHALFKQIQRGQEWLQRGVQPLTSFYRERWLPFWQRTGQATRRKWEKTKDFFHQRQQRALAFLQQKQAKLKALSYHHLVDRFLSSTFLKLMPLRLQQWLKRTLIHPIASLWGERSVRAYAYGIGLIWRLLSKCLQSLATAGRTFVTKGQQFLASLMVFKAQIFKALSVSCSFIKKGLHQGFYHGLLFTTMGGILFIWGMRAVGELTASLFAKLPFHRSSK